MGTEYKLYKDISAEIIIDEMSNKLSIFLTYADADFITCSHGTEEMTPEELAKIFLKGLTVCSYWMDTDELKEMINKHVEKEIY